MVFIDSVAKTLLSSMIYTVWAILPKEKDYWISISGAVYSTKSKTTLKPYPSNNGYLTYFSVNKGTTAHTMVLETFVPRKQVLDMVLHRNDVKHDNRLENLYYGDKKQNALDASRNGRLFTKRVKVTNPEGQITICESLKEAATLCKSSSSNLCNAIKVGKTKNRYKAEYV